MDKRMMHGGGAGAGVGGQHANLPARDFGNQQDATYRSAAGDTRSGDHLQAQARQLAGRDNAEIGLARLEPVGALRRDAEVKVEEPLLVSVEHAPDQRDGVEIADSANAQLSSAR